ncbi:MAG: TetR/AcrR family transcriptional regulator [Thermoleophilia bacterium]|nr:TetR/AcrR family transcriptional regulator [Thermoleophilia bacterium]
MPRDGTATRNRILDSAERLVLERGFGATSVDAVIAASKSSKGAFFHHFASKDDLGRALVARYAASDIEHLERYMAAAEAESEDPARQVVAFVRLFEEDADDIVAAQPSCLYVSFVNERQLDPEGTAEPIVEAIVAWRVRLLEKMRAAAERSPVPEGLDLEALADHVFVTFEGAFILARSLQDGAQMRRQLRLVRMLLEQTFGVGPGA